jgi:dienelactone hydrolase
MNIIIVADIFGKTPGLIKLGEELSVDFIIDPYDGKFVNFDNEAQAYSYFTEHIGLDAYVEKLSQIIKQCSDDVILIGFSVGAAAIWRLSSSNSEKIEKIVKHATCFYGSQIRHSTELLPTFDIKLIFPKSEIHFDVNELKLILADKAKVKVLQVDYLHGFMNPYSKNFNQAGYSLHVASLKQELKKELE